MEGKVVGGENGYHQSVFLKEVVDALVSPGGGIRDVWCLDATLGDGGHSIEILKRGGKVVAIDVDPVAIERAKERLGSSGYSENSGLELAQGNFRDINNLKLKQTDTAGQEFAGAIFDLGVSSLQLMSPGRGFSFMKEGPLDMRMDPSLNILALDLLNNLSRKELYGLFRSLGEEKYSKRLADTLVRAREIKPITTTLELVELVVRAVGVSGKVHPATRIFQALRIAVNDELGALEEGLNQVRDLIEKNGRIVVISFHSLEDRIVKNTFKQWKLAGIGEVLTKKPIIPSEMEISVNLKSRSAKMRVFKKL